LKRDQDDGGGRPLWVDGEMTLRVVGPGREDDRVIRVARPFALVGQAADNDVRVASQDACARHAYLHLDRRGLFVVDLVSRTGTRVDGTDRMSGWLRPGQGLEVAGHRIELLGAEVDGEAIDPPPCDDEMLACTGASAPLVGVSLESGKAKGGPWELGSELVFLGWSASCGIQVRDASAAKAHCALARTAEAAYVVDLCGRRTWVDGLAVRGGSALGDGQELTIGSTSYRARVSPAPLPATGRDVALVAPPPLVAEVVAADEGPAAGAATALDLIPVESQRALLAWVLEEVRGSHGEAIRQQGEMQVALAGLIRQIQQDNARLLDAHLERIEKVDRELAQLRAELSRRPDPAATAKAVRPAVPPLRVARIAPTPADQAHSKTSTAWLLERVSQLEEENRTTWRDMLARFYQSPRRAT
jgi:hypothetical protein